MDLIIEGFFFFNHYYYYYLKRLFTVVNVTLLENELKAGYKLTSEYKLIEAVEKFNNLLLLIPLLVLDFDEEKNDIMSLIRICVEYILALKCELEKSKYPVRFYNFSPMILFN